MRLFGLQMPVRMSRKTERALKQLERLCDEMGQSDKPDRLQTSRVGSRSQYVEGRTVRRTVMGPGAALRTSSATEVPSVDRQEGEVLRHSRLSYEEQVSLKLNYMISYSLIS